MRNFVRRLVLQALPLFVALMATAFLHDSVPTQRFLAMSLTPAFVAPSDEVLFERAVENCKEREWRALLLGRQACEFKDSKKIEQAISEEKRAARERYVWEQAGSKMDFIEEATEVVFGLLAFALTVVFVVNLYRLVKETGMPNLPERLKKLFETVSSRKAERDFMRCKRLFDNGLLSEEEFERKKRELKPKILQGGL